jgi:hypothetical protein
MVQYQMRFSVVLEEEDYSEEYSRVPSAKPYLVDDL